MGRQEVQQQMPSDFLSLPLGSRKENQRGEDMEQTFVMPIYYGINDYWKRELKKLRK